MDPSIRRHEYNRIMDQIRYLDMVIVKDENTANRMRHQTISSFTTSQITKIHHKNIERKETRDNLTNRLKKLDSGLLDNELLSNINKQMIDTKQKTKITRQKKKALSDDKKAKSVISKAYYQASRKQDRQNRYLKRNMERSYHHFTRACNSIPDYMRRNLSSMPNNKGYLWKSVACYGELPAEIGQPTVLFDRKRGGIMVIHEWNADQYRKFEKKGKEPKVLVHTSVRKKRHLPPICEDMLREERKQAERLASRRKRSSERGRRSRNRPKRGDNKRGDNKRGGNKYGRGTGNKC